MAEGIREGVRDVTCLKRVSMGAVIDTAALLGAAYETRRQLLVLK
jgi:hypothetical protein